jgi:GT2 family glycosyltransferase
MTLSATLVFLNWNGRGFLEQCLPSAFGLDYAGGVTVVVVDNGSSDDSVPFLRRNYPQVRLIENGRNLGYAGGMNVGLAVARSDVSVILNNDVILDPDWLSALLAPLATDLSIGVAGCKIYYPDGCTLQHAGGAVIPPRMVTDHFGYRERDVGRYETLRDVDYVTSAAMALRMDMLNEIGYLDAGFFPIYYDDVEICYRARDAGYRVVYVPGSTMIHLESATVGYASLRYLMNMHRGRLRFALKRLTPQTFAQQFVPAEVTWLSGTATADERQVMPRVYLSSMLTCVDLFHRRWGQHSEPDEIGLVLNGLAHLRDAVWNTQGLQR